MEGHDSYKTLFELAGVGLAQIDPASFRFLRVNRKLCEVTGYSEEELLGVTPIDITHPEDWVADRPAFEGLLRGDFAEHVVEKRYVRKDGSPAWVMVTLNPIRGERGELLHLVSVVRDIDWRKRIEADLEKRNRALTFISDTATSLLMSERPGELIPSLAAGLAAHLEAEVFAGHLFDAADGRLHLVTCSPTLDPTVRGMVETMDLGQYMGGAAALRQRPVILEDAQSSDDPAAELVRAMGMRAWVCQPLLAAERLMGTLSLGTRRRAAFGPEELELVRTTCDQVAMALERRRLMDELEHRASDLTQANRAKDQFLAVLSHELRTPLTPVLLSASAMESDPSLPRPAREEMTVIRQNVEVEARLIDDLLDLTRIARGKLELVRKPVGVHELIRQAMHMVSGEAVAKRLVVEHELSAREDTVEGDSARLQQIFWNLLKNAIKFTPEGGRVMVRTRNGEPRGARVVVEVEDTGIGISAEVLPKVFEAFEQGTPAVTRRFGGLGLGLAISRALAAAHQGTLTASSGGKDRGSVFVLTLPTVNAAVEGVTQGNAGEGARVGKLKILLVEDHASTASTLARLLRKSGHAVSVATGMGAAIELSEGQAFDLLISDIGLPDGTGLELVRRLKERRPGLSAIALSGYGTDADVRRSLEAGFSRHLTKPISLEQLKGLTVLG